MKKAILLTYAILGLAIVSIAQIDAAVRVGDSLYFFKGANCVTYSLITKSVRNQPISTVWPSLAFSSDISSAFMLKDKLIFTKGTTYVEWDIQKKRGDIPQVINSGNFGFSSLDAAFEFPNSDNGGEGIEGKVYFFKSSVYSRSDLYDGVLDQKNKANSGWTGLGWSTIDAALTDDKNRVYFFKGDELAIVNVVSQTLVSKSKINVIFQLPSSWFASMPPPEITPPPVKPPQSGTNKSPEITIGTQTWATKNLDVKTYRDGSLIDYVPDSATWVTTTKGAWCYYDNDPSKGVLYNGYAVTDPRGLAPAGWHVPTREEFDTLIDFYGGKNIAGSKMKDPSGFAALFGGYRYSYNGLFFGNKSRAYFWTSTLITATSPSINYRLIYSGMDTIYSGTTRLTQGFSVRLIKGNTSSSPSIPITTKIPVVKIGTQTWMAKDLNVKNYRNGTPIPQVQDPAAWAGLTSGAWCYYDNADPSKGILYNWYAVNEKKYGGLAPADWYIPTKAELTTLTNNGINMINTQFVPGKGGVVSNGQAANNGLMSYYWSATRSSSTNSNSSWALSIENSTGNINPGEYDWKLGFSVRCIQKVVQIQQAITGWSSTTKAEFTREVIKKLERAAYNSKQCIDISSCILSNVEAKYPDYNNLNLLSAVDRQKMEQDVFSSCCTYLKIPPVQIQTGSKIWSIYDLDVTTYRDGTPIRHVQDVKAWSGLTEGAYCYVDINDPSKGVLYNWYAVSSLRMLAPLGWHIPNNFEWTFVNSNWVSASYFEGGLFYHDGVNILNNGAQRWWWTSQQHDSFFAGIERGQKTYNSGMSVSYETRPKNWGLRVRCIKD